MLLVIPLLHKDLRAGTMSNAPERLIAVPACASLRVTRELEQSVPLRLINQEQVQRTLRGRGAGRSSTTTRWRGHRKGVPHRLSSELSGEGAAVALWAAPRGCRLGRPTANCLSGCQRVSRGA